MPSAPTRSLRARASSTQSIPYAVCAYYGIDTGDNSFGYLAHWTKDEEFTELRASLKIIIMKTSDCSRFVSEFLFPKNKRVRLWRAVRFWGTVRFWDAVRRFTDKKYGRSCKVCGERKSSESFARLRERPRYADNVLGKAPAIEINTLYAGELRYLTCDLLGISHYWPPS